MTPQRDPSTEVEHEHTGISRSRFNIQHTRDLLQGLRHAGRLRLGDGHTAAVSMCPVGVPTTPEALYDQPAVLWTAEPRRDM